MCTLWIVPSLCVLTNWVTNSSRFRHSNIILQSAIEHTGDGLCSRVLGLFNSQCSTCTLNRVSHPYKRSYNCWLSNSAMHMSNISANERGMNGKTQKNTSLGGDLCKSALVLFNFSVHCPFYMLPCRSGWLIFQDPSLIVSIFWSSICLSDVTITVKLKYGSQTVGRQHGKHRKVENADITTAGLETFHRFCVSHYATYTFWKSHQQHGV